MWNVPVSTTTEVLPAVVNVTESGQLGIHMTKGPQKEFNFGGTYPGTHATKTMNLTRGNAPPAFVHINVSGEIAPLAEIDRNDFLLDEHMAVKITLIIPTDAEQGRYTGNVSVRYTVTYGKSLVHLIRKVIDRI